MITIGAGLDRNKKGFKPFGLNPLIFPGAEGQN